jgi:hypothetical protein
MNKNAAAAAQPRHTQGLLILFKLNTPKITLQLDHSYCNHFESILNAEDTYEEAQQINIIMSSDAKNTTPATTTS